MRITFEQRRAQRQLTIEQVSDLHAGFCAAREGSHCLVTQSDAWQEGWRLYWQSRRSEFPRHRPHVRIIRSW